MANAIDSAAVRMDRSFRRRWERFFSRCPGVWFGNPPEPFGPGSAIGNVTVDPEQIVPALAMMRRVFEVHGTRLQTAVDGVLFEISWK